MSNYTCTRYSISSIVISTFLIKALAFSHVNCCFFQVFRGLAYIHTVPGVCHRDLKPQNILVLLFDDWKVDLEIEMSFLLERTFVVLYFC